MGKSIPSSSGRFKQLFPSISKVQRNRSSRRGWISCHKSQALSRPGWSLPGQHPISLGSRMPWPCSSPRFPLCHKHPALYATASTFRSLLSNSPSLQAMSPLSPSPEPYPRFHLSCTQRHSRENPSLSSAQVPAPNMTSLEPRTPSRPGTSASPSHRPVSS